MENLKSKFEKLNSIYQSKRENFKKVISKWQKQGKINFYDRAMSLLQQADAYSIELKEDFVVTSEGQLNIATLRNKVKQFKKIYKELNEITKPSWRQWLEAILVAGSLVFVLRTYVFGLYHVPTGSAEPTILVGDRIWGNKMIYYFNKINRGDYIVLDDPRFICDRSNPINYFWQKYIGIPIPVLGLNGGPENWTKRVIAIPGDKIEGRVQDGKTVIYLNEKKLDETEYVNQYPLIRLKKTTGFINANEFGPFKVPSFLQRITKMVDYTYDPNKSLEQQPFYNTNEDEIVRKWDGEMILQWPYTPKYEYGGMFSEFTRSIDSFGPMKVPQGKYWVMGDSRENSQDSRYWGFLDEDLVHGRASFIIYSVDSEEPIWLFELLKHPIDFWTKSIRWDRFLKLIKHTPAKIVEGENE